MKGTQARLPYTLPTPGQARQKLREARGAVASAADDLAKLREDLRSARAEAEAAETDLTQAEHNMLDAAEDSPESAAADADQGRLWRRLLLAESGIENLKATIVKAAGEHDDARRLLRGARGDLEAVRQGRRKR